MNILRYKDAAQKVGVSIITIRRWATLSDYDHLGFPRPIVLGENSRGFVESEVDDFLARRAANRDS